MGKRRTRSTRGRAAYGVAAGLSAGIQRYFAGRSKSGSRPAKRQRVAVRNKFAVSRTLTKTKTGSKIKTFARDGAGAVSYFRHLRRARAKYAAWRLSAKAYQSYQSTGRVTSIPGRQQVAIPFYMFPQTDMGELIEHMQESADNQRTSYTYFHDCKGTMMMTNNSTSSLEYTIYDCMAKKGTNESPLSAWKNGLTTPYSGDGGLVLSGTPLAEAGHAGQWNTGPFTSALFRSLFRVRKITRKLMGPGQTHKHVVTIAPNRIIKPELDLTSHIGGVTYIMMIVISGGQIDTGAGNVSVASAHIDYAFTKTYKTNRVLAPGDVYRSLTTGALPDSLPTETNINPESGYKAPVAFN